MASSHDRARSYVVLIGDVRVGKSTIVERLTDKKGLSSDQSRSFTTSSRTFVVPDANMEICDTPGTNPLTDRFTNNLWIAAAFANKPVSALVIVVKADLGLSNVIDNVIKYAEGFLEFDGILGVCVTHMDIVSWKETEFREALVSQSGLESVVFARIDTKGDEMLRKILSLLKPAQDLTIHSDNFLKFFKINDRNLKILSSVRKEVQLFETMRQRFYEQFPLYNGNEKRDLLFEFSTWLNDFIDNAQKRVAEINQFEFYGPTLPNEAGHIANLTHQLKTVLFDIRTRSLEYAPSHGINELRRCPYCGEVWYKVDGCDTTRCGTEVNLPESNSGGIMATFQFAWVDRSNELRITRRGQKRINPVRSNRGLRGCGRQLIWSNMAVVNLPPEFSAVHKVSTDDVNLIQPVAMPPWRRTFEERFSELVVEHVEEEDRG